MRFCDRCGHRPATRVVNLLAQQDNPHLGRARVCVVCDDELRDEATKSRTA